MVGSPTDVTMACKSWDPCPSTPDINIKWGQLREHRALERPLRGNWRRKERKSLDQWWRRSVYIFVVSNGSSLCPSAFAASVWLNDVFLNTSFGKYVNIVESNMLIS